MRTLKPEFATSEAIVELDKVLRLHFALLWTYADDEGRGLDNARLIKAAIWPLDDDVTLDQVERWQAELARRGRIRRYIADSKAIFEVSNFGEHQRPNRPVKSKLPKDGVPREDDVPAHVQDTEDSLPTHDMSAHKPLSEDAVTTHEPLTPVVVVGGVVGGVVVDGETTTQSQDYTSTDRLKPSSDDDEVEQAVRKAAGLLARCALDDYVALGGTVGNPGGWLVSVGNKNRAEHGSRLAELIRAGATAEQAAEQVSASPRPAPRTSPEDSTARAQRALMEENSHKAAAEQAAWQPPDDDHAASVLDTVHAARAEAGLRPTPKDAA